MDSLGIRLKEERIRLGLSQIEFVAITGLHVNAQRQYESGARLPKADYLEAITRHGVDIRYVLFNERGLDDCGVLTEKECLAINAYRRLDESCQESVRRLLRSLARAEQLS